MDMKGKPDLVEFIKLSSSLFLMSLLSKIGSLKKSAEKRILLSWPST